MAVSLKHKFTNPKPDGSDATIVRPSNWNDEHDLVMTTSRLLGRVTAGTGAVEELTDSQVKTLLALALDDLSDVDLTTTPPTPGDGFVYDGTDWVPGPAGGGMFKGDNGTVGSRSGDIFRINLKTLSEDVTIASTENASATGPLAVASGKTLTVASGGTMVIL
jgi:hypothetical protein